MANANSTALKTFQFNIDRILSMHAIIKRDGFDSFFDWAAQGKNVMTIGAMMDDLHDAALTIKAEVNHE